MFWRTKSRILAYVEILNYPLNPLSVFLVHHVWTKMNVFIERNIGRRACLRWLGQITRWSHWIDRLDIFGAAIKGANFYSSIQSPDRMYDKPREKVITFNSRFWTIIIRAIKITLIYFINWKVQNSDNNKYYSFKFKLKFVITYVIVSHNKQN